MQDQSRLHASIFDEVKPLGILFLYAPLAALASEYIGMGAQSLVFLDTSIAFAVDARVSRAPRAGI